MTAAKADRIRLESEIQQIQELGDNVDALLAIPSIAAAPAVNDRRRDVAQLETAVAGLAQRYKDKHPKMMAARAALSEAKDALKRAVVTQPAVLQSMLEQARATEANLTVATQEQEKAAKALNKAAIGYQELARQAETDRALYESVLRQIKETNLTKDVKTNAVTVIEHSPLPGAPVSPSPAKAIALGLLGGLALGLAFVYVSDALDRSIKTVDQAEAHFGLPVLAAVPEVKKTEVETAAEGSAPPGSASYRLVAEAPEGPAAEAFRNLRASLSLLGPEAERKVFLFTSALPNEGKSFTSANYALALAQQGFRVLLIDGDLRRPSLHKIFLPAVRENGAEEDRPGMVDYLVGNTDLNAAARPVSAGAFDLGSANGEAGVLTSTGGQALGPDRRTARAQSRRATQRSLIRETHRRGRASLRPCCYRQRACARRQRHAPHDPLCANRLRGCSRQPYAAPCGATRARHVDWRRRTPCRPSSKSPSPQPRLRLLLLLRFARLRRGRRSLCWTVWQRRRQEALRAKIEVSGDP